MIDLDMQQPLKLEDAFFCRSTDSDIYQRSSDDLDFDAQFWKTTRPQKNLEEDSLGEIINKLKNQIPIIDIPLENLINFVEAEGEINQDQRRELLRRLRKIKIILKRQRAKSRQLTPYRHILKTFRNIGAKADRDHKSQEDQKKLKNRLSAQISRDKKKQDIKKLSIENQELKEDNLHLRKQNERITSELQKLKQIKQINQELLSFIFDCVNEDTIRMPLSDSKQYARQKSTRKLKATKYWKNGRKNNLKIQQFFNNLIIQKHQMQ